MTYYHSAQPLLTTIPPFVGTFRKNEEHKKTLYGCAFDQYNRWPDPHLLAAVGNIYVHLYSCPEDSGEINSLWTLEVQDWMPKKSRRPDEDLYTVCWCLDTIELAEKKCGKKIVVAGAAGHIYIIDLVTKKLENLCIDKDGSVNDLRTDPTNSNFFLVACSNHAIRIFHIRNNTAVFWLQRHHDPPYAFLSADWSPNADYILSCDVNSVVFKWDLTTDRMKEHRARVIYTMGQIRTKNCLQFDKKYLTNPFIHHLDHDNTYTGWMPYAIGMVEDMHSEMVDCVRAVAQNSQQFVFSKGTGEESSVFIWKFGLRGVKSATHNVPSSLLGLYPPESNTTLVTTKKIPDGDNWFNKFGVDPNKKWIVCGGSRGLLSFFSLETMKPSPNMIVQASTTMLRQVDFCRGGRIVAAVGDEGFVARCDRNVANVRTDFGNAFW